MKTSSNNKFYENYKKLYQNYFLRNPLDRYLLSLVNLEAAVCICFSKYVFLKISLHLQENNCVGVSFLKS